MCGIVGIFDTRARRELDRDLLRRMNQVQLHRGPDAGGEHCEPGVALGHRRLAIIDVSSGQQPLWNEDGSVVVVFNGEIYNFPDLVTELQAAGHVFRTHSDTEVIVHAWEQWGADCVQRFNGMFAFALWDRNRRTLFLARDRLGKKPLYYALLGDGRLLFSSELKSILEDPALPRDIDPRAVEEYLGFGYVPDPRTILKAVHKLPPAHLLLWEQGGPEATPRAYWDVAFQPVAVASEAAAGAELAERLREATRIRLMSEVPLGAFLSGGVDSSAVVAMMAGLSADPVKTCSIAFGAKEFDESEYAREVAERYRTDHFVRQVDTDDFGLLDTLAAAYDEPFADSSAIPTYRVCQLARTRVTVALSGDGGDEALAGYRRYKWFMNEQRVRELLPDPLRIPLFSLAGRLYPKLDWAPKPLRAKTTLEAIGRDAVAGYFHGVSITADRVRLPLYSGGFRDSLGGHRAVDVLRAHAARSPTRDPLSLVQYLDFKTYLPGDILVKVDRASMAHSLEVRAPLLDYTLIDWISGLPAHLKLRNGEGKYIFKKSLEPYLSERILYRPKMGFAVPLAAWLRGPLRERVRERLLGERATQGGIFERAEIEKVVRQHETGARDNSSLLWALLMLDASLARLVPPGARGGPRP
jgi:asparagine synthase (glutamine-hydrolysing)